MGFSLSFLCSPSPPATCDGSDNGLASRVNVNMLDSDLLLPAFAAFTVQGSQQFDKCAGCVRGGFSALPCSFKGLLFEYALIARILLKES